MHGEKAHTINGVEGRLFWGSKPGAALFTTQKWIGEKRRLCDAQKDENGRVYQGALFVRPEIRFDDTCNNGRHSFAVTGTITEAGRGEVGGGCCHDEIVKAFPELAPLVKWHLFDSNDPMHYVANTLYHAGDRDCHGLRKGEKRQLRNGKTGLPSWELVAVDETGEEVPTYKLPKHYDGETPPDFTPTLKWAPWCRVGEGKERDLAAARSVAVWPEATDAELSAEPEDLKAALLARLPALVAAFRADVDGAGFMWEVPESERA